MESGAKWAAFIAGVVLLALAVVFGVRDWRDGGDFSVALPAVLGVLGAMALAVGLSRAPLDPRAARGERDSADKPPRG